MRKLRPSSGTLRSVEWSEGNGSTKEGPKKTRSGSLYHDMSLRSRQ